MRESIFEECGFSSSGLGGKPTPIEELAIALDVQLFGRGKSEREVVEESNVSYLSSINLKEIEGRYMEEARRIIEQGSVIMASFERGEGSPACAYGD